MPTGRFYRARVATLSAILALVLIYAARDIARRGARTDWEQPLKIGIVLLELTTEGQSIGPEALSLLDNRMGALEQRLNSEFERYRSASPAMFEISVYGPVAVLQPPPAPLDDGWFALLQNAYQLWRYTSQINTAARVPARGLDSTIYVVAEPVTNEDRKQVEGFSQQGGHYGVARIQLDESTVDLCLFVVGHELMHTLGASDKYDATGRTIKPEGLGDPEQQPLYPQAYAEVMARNRVLSDTKETIPVSLEELRVGRFTAKEIGWIP